MPRVGPRRRPGFSPGDFPSRAAARRWTRTPCTATSPTVWARYLREVFQADRALIALTFRVDDRTVRAWLDGLNAPKGSVVALAAIRDPEFFAALGVAA